MNDRRPYFFLPLLILGLVFIRLYEDALFYDPFISYFKADFTALDFPVVEQVRWLIHTGIRYGLNSLLSLVIMHVVFNNTEITRLSAFLFFGFCIFFLLFIWVAYCFLPEQKMLFFYVRRFLIQPLLLLIFIPAFYFHLKITQNKEL